MRAYLQISGAIFGVIALLHVVRLLLGWRADVAGWAVPFWISWMAIFAAGALSVWAFRLLDQARQLSRPFPKSSVRFATFLLLFLALFGFWATRVSHPATWEDVWILATAVAECLVAWVIFHEVGEARRTSKQEFIRVFFDAYATPGFQNARALIEDAPFTDLSSFERHFASNPDPAATARRRIKHLLGWLGNLIEAGLLSPEDAFFVDLPYRLYKNDDGSDGRLLVVEKELLVRNKVEHLYHARVNSVWYAQRCAERYQEHFRARLRGSP